MVVTRRQCRTMIYIFDQETENSDLRGRAMVSLKTASLKDFDAENHIDVNKAAPGETG